MQVESVAYPVVILVNGQGRSDQRGTKKRRDGEDHLPVAGWVSLQRVKLRVRHLRRSVIAHDFELGVEVQEQVNKATTNVS